MSDAQQKCRGVSDCPAAPGLCGDMARRVRFRIWDPGSGQKRHPETRRTSISELKSAFDTGCLSGGKTLANLGLDLADVMNCVGRMDR